MSTKKFWVKKGRRWQKDEVMAVDRNVVRGAQRLFQIAKSTYTSRAWCDECFEVWCDECFEVW